MKTAKELKAEFDAGKQIDLNDLHPSDGVATTIQHIWRLTENFGDAYEALRDFCEDDPATLYAAIRQLLYLESGVGSRVFNSYIDSEEIINILRRCLSEQMNAE